MKRLLLTGIAMAALVIAGQAYSAGFQVPNRGGKLLSMMGGGHGYGGGHMGGGGYGGNGYDRDRNAPPQRYRDEQYRYDRHGDRYHQGQRQELRDELHRQRRDLSEMIRSGDTDPDAVDRKMYRIEGLERSYIARPIRVRERLPGRLC